MKLYSKCSCGAEFSGSSWFSDGELLLRFIAFEDLHRRHARTPPAEENEGRLGFTVVPGTGVPTGGDDGDDPSSDGPYAGRGVR